MAADHAHTVAGAAAVAVIAGSMVLVGWALDIAVLKSILPGWVSMKANTAVCFIMTGVALWLAARLPVTSNPRRAALFSRLARLCVLLVGLTGLLTMGEYIFGWGIGIDQWLIREQAGTVGTPHPGRMAPETALSFVFLSVALWVNGGSRKTRYTILASASLGLLVLALALAALLSYLTPGLGAYGWFGLTIMAVHTAMLFAMLGMAVIAISWRPDVLPWSLNRRITAAFACGMAVLVFIGFTTSRSQFRMKEIGDRVAYTEKIESGVESLQAEIIDAHVHARDYAITGDERSLASYLSAKADSNAKLDALRQDELVTAEPVHQQHFTRIGALANAQFQWLQQMIDVRRTGMADAAHNNMAGHAQDLLDGFRTTLEQAKNDHHQLIQQLKRDSESVSRLSYFIIFTGTLSSLLIFLAVIIRLNFAVNKRKLAEEAMRLERDYSQRYLDATMALMVALDSDGNITMTNHTARNLLGYAEKELLGRNWFDTCLPPDERDIVLQVFRQAMAGSIGLVREFENPVLCRDGGRRVIAWRNSELTDTAGRIVGVLSSGIDITERKRIENELQGMLGAANQSRLAMLGMIEEQKLAEEAVRRLNAELEEKVAARTADLERARIEAEQANRAKSAFLAAMSHEIRTPMNGVIGMIDVLQQSSLIGPQVEMVNIIHESAFALMAIIDDILDFSKIEAGKLQIDSMPMAIADVVEKACETMDHMAFKKEVELTLFTDPAIPAAVVGDPGRLRQILVNLASNAIKFSSGQRRRGKVSVRALLAESGLAESTPGQVMLEFRVADNGIGIDEQTQARLFTAFAQADLSATRAYGGTGLGLAISRQLANIMGGEITVHSEPGKGSLFGARIPFALPAGTEGRVSVRPLRQSRGGHVGLALHSQLTKPQAASRRLKPDLQNADHLIAGLSCLVVGAPESLADDIAAYLAHDGALVERAAGLAVAREWVASRPPGLCVVITDTAGSKPSLATPPPDELYAAARARPEQKTRFVAIGRGQRREPRLDDAGLVSVDGNVLTRNALLKAVALAAGRAKQPDREGLHGAVKTAPAPLSREEARRRGDLILVAEDNEINQKVILQQLMLIGRTADIANNGREALERWQGSDYAILFTDLHMPKMGGYELTAAIRAAEKTGAGATNKPRMPIIAFTANVLKGEAEHCLAVGMDDYLSKPVQLVSLKAMLEKWLPVVASDPIPAETTPTGTAPPQPPTAGTPAVVDVNVLKKLVGDDGAIIRDLLRDFRLSATKIAAELRAACTAGKAAAAGALAHKLKSSARSVGALALGELCAEMELAGKAGDSEALTALLPKFEQVLAGVEGFLEGY